MSSDRSLRIVHLYPREMNIYGDTGNVLVLQKRLQWRGIDAEILQVGAGEKLPNEIDIIVSGGGQDKGQLTVQEDLLRKGQQLNELADDGVVMLVICGTYQLFGHKFITNENKELLGISLFDAETIAGPERLIGNITTHTHVGKLVGYENHSGLTTLNEGQQPFGKVITGAGNNVTDDSEGAVKNNVFGTYLHGPILPKNHKFADELIRRALVRKYEGAMLSQLDDDIADQASDVAMSRPR